MRFGLFASILFHLSILGAIVLWGQDWSRRGDVVVEPSIPVELISEARLAELTNVPSITTREIEAPEPEPEIPDDPVPVLQPDPIIIEPEPETIAAPPAPEPEPEVVEPGQHRSLPPNQSRKNQPQSRQSR